MRYIRTRKQVFGEGQFVVLRAVASDRSDSRIPVASFGTAEEDALRRDFTLNALFYNANTRLVEDLTGR